MYSQIPTLSFISAALALVPLFWYFQARNIAAVAIGIWLSVTNLIYAVDALLLDKDASAEASVWCDISTLFITGSRIALPAACLSICIHLEHLASFSSASTPQAQRRRIIFECLMSLGLPVMYTALHLIVQPRRFDLFYGFGCRPATYPTVATIFLVIIPPISLTVATIACTGSTWRHFLAHGVQFYGKRGSASSLTRNLYLRLVGMALSEAIFSALLIAIVAWHILSPGLFSLEKIPRHLNETLILGPDAITGATRTVLVIEWSVSVIQSALFFGLFACRLEVLRQGWQLVQSLLQVFKQPDPLMIRCSLARSSTGTSVPSLPTTVVHLPLVDESASTLMPYDLWIHKSCPSTPRMSCPSSIVVVEDGDMSEDIVISALAPALIPLESPSRASAIASSHNSLASNFDPSKVDFRIDTWPRTPTTVPARVPRRPSSVGHVSEQESWLEVGHDYDDPPFPRAKTAVHIKSRTADVFRIFSGCGTEKRHATYVTVGKETFD